MEYLSVADARSQGGMRLVLSIGVPGPWGEAAKSIFHVKGIGYAAVAQYPGMANDDLVAWTGCANAPIAVYDDESPRSGWAEILLLAERLAPEPRLIPDREEERAMMFGVCHEICGEGGLGWSRRLMLIDQLAAAPADSGPRLIGETLGRRYGYSRTAAAAAPERVAKILVLLSTLLERQRDRGNEFLLGPSLSAADLYWAAFAVMFDPLPPDLCPMSDAVRGWYANTGPVIAAALDPELVALRDRIYRNYLPLPMSF
jgi:glutathione S-transferase